MNDLVVGKTYEVVTTKGNTQHPVGTVFKVVQTSTTYDDCCWVEIVGKGNNVLVNLAYYVLSERVIQMSFTAQQKKEAQEQLSRMEAEMNKLKDIINAPEKSVLDIGYHAHYMDGAGRVCDHGASLKHSGIGNTFLQKAHAEAFTQQFKIWCLVNSRAAILADGWKPDWKDHEVNKGVVYFSHHQKKFVVEARGWSDYLAVCLPTEEKAQQLADWLNQHVKYDNGTWLLDGRPL